MDQRVVIRLDVGQLASVFWAHELKIFTQSESFYQLGQILHLHPDSHDAHYWQRQLQSYAYGVVPHKRTVTKIENIIPGSRESLRSPLWQILSNPDALIDELEYMLRLTSGPLHALLFHHAEPTERAARKKITKALQFNAISRITSLDALGTLLILMREAELTFLHDDKDIAAFKRHNDLKWSVNFMLARLMLVKAFEYIAYFVGTIIDERFLSKNTSLPKTLKGKKQHAAQYLHPFEFNYFFLAVVLKKRYEALISQDTYFKENKNIFLILYDKFYHMSRYSTFDLALLVQSEMPFKFDIWCVVAAENNACWFE